MVSVLIPARNEEDRVADTVRGVVAGLRALGLDGFEILVVDDGSSDGTAREAEEAGATVVMRLSPGRGKGAALNAALKASRGDVVLTVDADLGVTAREVDRLLAPVLWGDADMAIASLPAAGRTGGFSLVVRLARWAMRRAGGQDVAAPLSGQRAMRRRLLDEVGGFEEGFGVETGLTLEALRRGCRVVAVPTQMEHRALGRTARGFVHRGQQLLHVARVIWRKRAWRRP